jgi:hypothetical protein
MGLKSRGNWATGACLKRCANRDKKCDDCFGFSEFVELNEFKELTSDERRANEQSTAQSDSN